MRGRLAPCVRKSRRAERDSFKRQLAEAQAELVFERRSRVRLEGELSEYERRARGCPRCRRAT